MSRRKFIVSNFIICLRITLFVVLCALHVFSIEPNIGPGWFAGPADQSTLSGMIWYGINWGLYQSSSPPSHVQ